MDLENFENGPPELHVEISPQDKQLSPKTAVRFLDDVWYTPATRRARWMDLIGDYGGKETFFIDGDSLLQIVLDTPFLALGRSEDPETKRVENSFQLLHAKFILEKLLFEFKQRDANFEVVFFNGSRHTSIGTDYLEFQTHSRALARKMLFHHMVNINIPVHSFDSPQDPTWIELVSKKQPMFIMVNDGGTPIDTADDWHFQRSLLQRALLFELSRQGLAFALLKGTEYRDSKVMTFVFESRTHVQTMHPVIQNSINLAHKKLDERLGYPTPLSTIAAQRPLEWWSTHIPGSDLGRIFLVHALILSRIPVELCARKLPVLHSSLEVHLQETFLPSLFRDLARFDTVFPNIDGRLFLELLDFVIETKTTSVRQLFPSLQMADEFLLTFDGPGLSTLYPSPSRSFIANSPPSLEYQLLPFSNRVFDTALADLHISVTSESNFNVPHSVFGMQILTEDTKHWHNTRSILPLHLGGQKSEQLTDWMKKRRLRKEQRDQARLQKQAASLTGASGNVLERIAIPAVGTRSAKSKAKSSKPIHAATGANKARAKIQEAKSKEIGQQAVEWWEARLKAMKNDSLDDQLKSVDLLKRNRSPKATYPVIAFEIRLYQLHLQLKRWTENPALNRDDMLIMILRLLSEIKRLSVTIPAAGHKFLLDICKSTGFESYSDEFLPDADSSLSPPAFKPIKLVSKKVPLYSFMAITSSPVQWQLEHFGEYMDRSMDSTPDLRVAFSPDRWQRDVLDAIDRNESLLALAPTSAGKTFISFYAMEKILRESNDGILVYVAPTKALVNQIAAEVYGRFSKIYPGNQTLLAVHTRDTRTGDIQRAQILITVPEMLGILILSPTLARNWTSRVKRIVLDEIHSIGQEQEGAVWEQIILLAPCPVIGLSATVGSPEQFNQWLESVQQAHHFTHVYIHHPHRYSHLRKFFYLSSTEKSPRSSLSSHEVSERMTFLHPLSLLSDHSSTLPTDMALESRDCASLYTVLHKHSLVEGDEFHPDNFFKGHGLLRQKDILKYEKALKDIVIHSVSHDPNSMHKIVSSLTDKALSDAKVDHPPSRDDFKQGLIMLVYDLHKLDKLPAILFSFDRTDCEIMARFLTGWLEKAEENWKKSSSKWKARLAEVEAWRNAENIRSDQRRREMKQKKDPDAPREETSSHAWQANFNEDDPLPDFSFAGRPPSKEELEEVIRDLSNPWARTPPWAISALLRGVAVHHAGMSKAYRVAIENLFRQGFIRIMISTGTLALGINAPARTSVFCGDSPYLTALMYRQCAGRAGRRGFDLLGNVVFYGLPYSRVQRLVLSRLPALGDSFPLTSTLILRLFNLLQGSNYADFAVQSIKSIMSLPRISHRSDMGRDQVLHHVRFSIEYLRQSGLLDYEGKPTNLFGMATHLYYTEPSNFALVHLFESGVIHQICSDPSSVKAEEDLLLLLCHLFGRKYVSRNYARSKSIARLKKKYPSRIILPPLPRGIGEQLQRHNNDILRMFSSYALSYASEHQSSLGIDNILPLSGPAADTLPIESPFIEHLNQTKIAPIARSIFAATSGLDDHFTSISDLVSTVRNGIYLHEHAIPSMQHLIDYSDIPNPGHPPEHEINAYILDFYTHSQLLTLAVANGIRRGDVWYYLQDFELVLKAIRSSLQELLIQLSLARSKGVDVDDLLDSDEVEEKENDDEDGDEGIDGFKRPPNTSDRDWKVYEIFDLVTTNFVEKYHKIFA
ncbi:P-loop containing nucleoside triphosphate hydrolase protein [Gymnopus androsaceus JB14]|uniref:P-loop containing nucleoside triphosphate hydrolase protein n=1 Tax=Gymnopus androsaceus JB14 TaxID=1447944 RepID=A0A6A4I6N7_9AGAR|nr:P-loop containing nucleoside triphosphate hydrolase protein [Gymnopus androsaceus JB14]